MVSAACQTLVIRLHGLKLPARWVGWQKDLKPSRRPCAISFDQGAANRASTRPGPCTYDNTFASTGIETALGKSDSGLGKHGLVSTLQLRFCSRLIA